MSNKPIRQLEKDGFIIQELDYEPIYKINKPLEKIPAGYFVEFSARETPFLVKRVKGQEDIITWMTSMNFEMERLCQEE